MGAQMGAWLIWEVSFSELAGASLGRKEKNYPAMT